MNDVKEHVNHIATTQCTHGVLIDDIWTLG